MGLAVTVEQLLPGEARFCSARADALAEMLNHAVRDVEFRVLGPAVVLLGLTDLILPQRFAVSRAGVLLVGGAIGDVTVDNDQGRPVVALEKSIDGAGQHLLIIGVADAGDVPAVGDEAGGNILAESQSRVALDGDLVVVINPAEVGELEMAGERGSLAADSLHHAAIPAHGIYLVVEEFKARAVEIGSRPAPGDGHTHAGGHALAQRAGCGFCPGGPMVLGVAGTLAVQLAKAADVIELDR